jgi:hypothetical protein
LPETAFLSKRSVPLFLLILRRKPLFEAFEVTRIPFLSGLPFSLILQPAIPPEIGWLAAIGKTGGKAGRFSYLTLDA